MFKLKGINYLLTLVGLQLLCPANFLLYLLEALKQKDIEVRVDPDCSIRLARPSVLENKGHGLLIDFEGSDGVPGKLNHLIFKLAPLPASVQSERVKGNNRNNMAVFSCIRTTVREDYTSVTIHLSNSCKIASHLPCLLQRLELVQSLLSLNLSPPHLLHCLMEQHGQGGAVRLQLCLNPRVEQPLSYCQARCCRSRVVCNVEGVWEVARLNLALKVVLYDLKEGKKTPSSLGAARSFEPPVCTPPLQWHCVSFLLTQSARSSPSLSAPPKGRR